MNEINASYLGWILALMELNRNSPANRRKSGIRLHFSCNEIKHTTAWNNFFFYWKLQFKVHVVFCMKRQWISRGIVWSISITNLQFKMTSLEHKPQPLVFQKILSLYLYEHTEFEQTNFSLGLLGINKKIHNLVRHNNREIIVMTEFLQISKLGMRE